MTSMVCRRAGEREITVTANLLPFTRWARED